MSNKPYKQQEFLASAQRGVRVRALQHTFGDGIVRRLRHVDAVPVCEIGRVAPNMRRFVARLAGVVRVVAAAACDKRISDTCSPMQNMEMGKQLDINRGAIGPRSYRD